jgi:hypothetical protein
MKILKDLGKRSKVDTNMEKLKLPTNPQDLLNLYSLRDQLRIKDEIETNLESYIWNYVKSFFLTSEEVLKYIPESKYTEYYINDMGGMVLPEGLALCNRDFKFAIETTKIYYIVDHAYKVIIPFGPLYEREHGTENIILPKNSISGRTFLKKYQRGYREHLEVCVSTQAKLYNPVIGSNTLVTGSSQSGFYKEINITFDMKTNSLVYVDEWRGIKEGFDRFSVERRRYRNFCR